jgi:hypothetical protein
MNRTEEVDEDFPFRDKKLSSGAERIRFLYKEYEPQVGESSSLCFFASSLSSPSLRSIGIGN